MNSVSKILASVSSLIVVVALVALVSVKMETIPGRELTPASMFAETDNYYLCRVVTKTLERHNDCEIDETKVSRSEFMATESLIAAVFPGETVSKRLHGSETIYPYGGSFSSLDAYDDNYQGKSTHFKVVYPRGVKENLEARVYFAKRELSDLIVTIKNII